MKVNLRGLALNAAGSCRSSFWAFELKELARHIEQVQTGKVSLQEFADFYCLTPSPHSPPHPTQNEEQRDPR
jgi:hypothetical protein